MPQIGPQGLSQTGTQGQDGAQGFGFSVLTFASNTSLTLTTILGGLVGFGGIVGNCGSALTPSLLGITVNLTGGPSIAGSIPDAGTLITLCAYFSTTVVLNLLASSVTVFAQIWTSSAPNNDFTAVGNPVALSPALSGNAISIGTRAKARVTGLSIPITPETRIFLMFTCTATGISLVNNIPGYFSGGVTIRM